MKRVWIALSAVALALLLILPVGVYLQRLEPKTFKIWMSAATLLWFGTAPLWMKKRPG